MVVSGLVTESQTPKIASQSSHHVTEKFSLDDPVTTTAHMFSNRAAGNSRLSKQVSSSNGGAGTNGGAAEHGAQQPATTSLVANTPSRRKSRQTSQKMPVGVNQVAQQSINH